MSQPPFSLPAIQTSVPVVAPKTGLMTAYFSDWLNRVLTQVSAQVNDINTTLAAIQATQAQLQATILTLQAVQQTVPGSGTSGFAQSTINVGLGWSAGPTVNLTGVAAGNLTINGSGPIQTDTTTSDPGTYTGDWRIQEIVGFVETTVFTGQFTASNSGGFQTLYNNTSTVGVSIPRASTGAVSYRLDLQFTDPVSALNVGVSLYVAR